MAALSDHPWPAAETPSRFVVSVTLVNEQGHRTKLLGFGATLADAIDNAAHRMRKATGDDWDAVAWETA